MAELTDGHRPANAAFRPGMIVQYIGAAVSLSLLIGVGVWGYKLLVRDANGIPVVRAMEGPMRMQPEAPGGELALHTGLAVNAVAAVGVTSPTEERLVLAPAMPELTQEDLETAVVFDDAEADEGLVRIDSQDGVIDEEAPLEDTVAQAEALEAESAPTVAAVVLPEVSDQPLTADQVLALADQIAAGAEPMTTLAPVPQTQSAEGVEVIAASVPGVARALRPPSRPGGIAAASAAPVATDAATDPDAAPPQSEIALRTEDFAVGTTLVQLGAFPSTEAATRAWTRVAADFSDYIGTRQPVIQQAQSAGETFYRLRAQGFEGLDDARRFCSALVAEGADCIPVVVR
jgi:hypothetical protein